MKTKFFLVAAVAAGLLLAGCGKSSSKQPAQTTNVAASSTNAATITSPQGYLGAIVQAQKSSEKKIDVAYLNQAIQLFNAQEGRYPKTLQELVPNYVGKIPPAPYGYKLDYDAKNGVVKVVKQ